MSPVALPPVLEAIFARDRPPDQILDQVLPALGGLLNCDRCFLYLRHPPSRLGQVPYCWRRTDAYADLTCREWSPEPETLAATDPLFAAALRGEAAIYIEDVETASPTILNRQFEAENFGHRALIHAHLVQQNQLWGILQPCVFGQPRPWSSGDRALITQMEHRLTPLALTYVETRISRPHSSL